MSRDTKHSSHRRGGSWEPPLVARSVRVDAPSAGPGALVAAGFAVALRPFLRIHHTVSILPPV